MADNLIKREEIEFVKKDYDIPERLAHGGSCTVYKGLYRNESVAIKQPDMLGPNMSKEKVINEAKLMLEFKGYPTLMRLEGVVVIKDGYLLVMELMPPPGSLDKFLKNNKNIPLYDKWVLMMDIVYALECLHANRTLHRDIKPANVFLKNGHAKLGDVGEASQTVHSSTNMPVTAFYVDPWFTSDTRYTEKSDIYSLGVLLYEMLLEQHAVPWEAFKIPLLELQIYKQKNPLKVPDTAPPTMKENLPSFWKKNRNQRPNVGMVFETLSTSKEEFMKLGKKI